MSRISLFRVLRIRSPAPQLPNRYSVPSFLLLQLSQVLLKRLDIGFRTGNGVAPSRNIVELWKLRSGAERSAIEGWANARVRSAGVRMRDAMVGFRIAEQDGVVN
ncbi:hypothetical protein HYFRA_00007875 [Hymenoscyphus fraxineus]|uniref:Uncharacterized protein n=1 Tax=Hymenoscyphus fraxineus TaxID=746836 RepID=A0A9N9PN56_9HELO|nr:hypothetical protein HYFRA_00007875 [Hymenoscyphus fraxineus]